MFSKSNKTQKTGLNFVSSALQQLEAEELSYEGMDQALNNLDAAGLLAGIEGEANRNAVLTYKYPKEIALAINRMSAEGLLSGNKGVVNFNDIIGIVGGVYTYAIGLEILNAKGLLDGEGRQANRNLLRNNPHAAVYFARMLCTLQDASFLVGLEGQDRRNALLQCTNFEFADVALSTLYKSGLLKGAAGSTNFEAVMIYQGGEAKSLLYDLEKAGLLSGPAGQANFNAVLKHQNLRDVNLELIYDHPDLLTGSNAQTNFDSLMARHATQKIDVSRNRIDANDVNISSSSNIQQEKHSSSMSNISMTVLEGVIAATGIAAVAIAFTLLNAATFGIAGLVVAGVGVAAALSGIGLFAAGTYKNRQSVSDNSLDLSDNLVFQ